MNFDWTKPLLIDWTGRSGPLISEEDIKNSVIHRILRNQFQAPFCEREIVRVKPWWSPRDPFGTNSENSHTVKTKRFIPGLHHPPVYPQLSTLSRQQHQQCLRVLSAAQDVQPRDYPQPTQRDYNLFEEIKELYEKEQKEYIKWAKQSWINGDCIRALRPKPTIEQVYEAEFKMKAYAAQSLPQNYTLAAQIPLETKSQVFEFEHKQDLINVDVEDLPNVEYPEEMDSDFSILKPCPVPEPCAEHPCKFVLPHENTVSNQPLSEINYELAQYAIGSGVSFVASENALHCLLETERSWNIPVSVVEVIGPDGDLRNVTVLGSEFGAQKECAAQRTYKAYKHLLRHRFAPTTGHYKMKPSTQQTATSTPTFIEEPIAKRLNRFESLDDDLAVSSDDDNKLQIDDHEPKSDPNQLMAAECKDSESDINECDGELNETDGESSRAKRDPNRLMTAECKDSESDINECDGELNETDGEPSSEPDRLMIDDNDVNITEPHNHELYIPNYSQNTEARTSFSNNEPTNEVDLLSTDKNDINIAEPCYNQDFYKPVYGNDAEARPSYSSNSRCSEPHRDMIDNNSFNNQVPFYNKDSYEPEYSNDFKVRPRYSRSEPICEPDQIMIDDKDVTNQVPFYNKNTYEPEYNSDFKVRPSYSRSEPIGEPGRLMIDDNNVSNEDTLTNQDSYESDYSIITEARPSYSPNEPSIVPDRLMNEDNDVTNQDLLFNQDSYEPELSNDTEAKPSYSPNVPSSEPDQLTINIIQENTTDTNPNHTKPDTSQQNIRLLEANKVAPLTLLETKENTAAKNSLYETIELETKEDGTPSLSKTNEDSDPGLSKINKDIVPRLFEANKEAGPKLFETNKDTGPKFFDTNKDAAATGLFETYKDAEPRLFEMYNDYDPRFFDMSEDYDPRFFYMDEESASIFFETNINEPTIQTKISALPKVKSQEVTGSNSNEPVTSEVTQLSPIKQCKVNSSKLNLEPCSGKQNISETNTENIKIPLKTYARSKSKKPSIITTNVFDQANQKPSTNRNDANCHAEIIKPITTEKTNEVTPTQLSPLKPCIIMPERSPRKNSPRKLCFSESITSRLTYEIDANNSQANKGEINRSDADKSRNVRGRRLSEFIYREHDYSIDQSENLRIEKQSKTSYEGSNSSQLSPEKSHCDKPKEPGGNRLSFNEASSMAHETKIEISDISNNRKQNIENIETNNSMKSNSTKTNRGKISIRELFGDESDSDEPNYRGQSLSIANRGQSLNKAEEIASSVVKMLRSNNEPSNKNSVCNVDSPEPSTRNVSYIDPASDKLSSIEKSPLKPILRKPSFSDSSPKTSKRKLSFSDPLTSDPEFMSFSEPDSEDAIVGFVNGVAVSLNQPKNTKNNQKETVLCTYSFRSRSRTKARPAIAAKKQKTTKSIKENSGITKIIPTKANKHGKVLETFGTRRQRISARLHTNDSDESNYTTCSRRVSSASNTEKTKQLTKIKNACQRSRSVSAHSYNDSDDSDSLQHSRISHATRKISKLTETEDVRPKSRRISSRLNAEDSDDSRMNETKKNNTDGLRRSRRLATNSTKENVLEDSDDLRTNLSNKYNIDGLRRSRRLSPRSTKENVLEDSDDSRTNETKKNDTDGLRRSRRLSTHSTKENVLGDSDDLRTNQTNKYNTDGLRRSHRLPTHSTKENVLEDSDALRTNQSKKYNIDGLRRSRRLSTRSTKENLEDSDDSGTNKYNTNGLRRSRRLSTRSTKENVLEDSDDSRTNQTNKYNTDRLRRSRRLSTRLTKENVLEDSDDSRTNKTNKYNTDGLRRSRRLSTRSTKENVSPKINQTKTYEKSLSLNTAKTTKKRQNRRKSLPANIYSNTVKLNQVIRSKSLTNLYESANIKKILRSGSKILSNSTKSLNATDTNISLELSERRKRYLRRTFNLACSESDQSEEEMSERTKRYIRRSISSAYSEVEISDTELKKRSKKYTRCTNSTSSYYARNSKNSKTGASLIDSIPKDTAVRTKRHVSRSISSASSSCDEIEQPMPIRRKGTKRQPKNMNPVNRITNTMDSSSVMETNQMNQSNAIQFKTEAMDTTESKFESTDQLLDENKIETHEIKITLYEEPNENIDETETFETSQLTEPNMDTREEISLITEEELFGDHQNTGNEIVEFDIFHFTASTETDVSGTESSDSENEMYICHSNTLDSINNLTNNAINETKDMGDVKTEIEESETSNFSVTNKIENKSHTTDANRPRTEGVLFKNANHSLYSNSLFIESDDGMENKVNHPVEPILTDSALDFTDANVTDDPNETIISRKLSISETSDSSDYYFDTNETEELNMFHFTATNHTDSEEESNWPSEDPVRDPSVSRTEEEKNKAINQTETNNTINKTDCVIKKSQNVKDSVFPSTSSGDRISDYETLNTAALPKKAINDIIGADNCTCKGTLFEVPPPRSFKKWQLRNVTSNVNFNIIVHSSHKVRKGMKEVLLEPIVEYQPELGGAKQSADKIRALALSLMLRESAGLINVRIDHDNGNVIAVDRMSSKQFVERHGDRSGDVADCLHTALNQLRYLMPGQYLLTHHSRHGANAMLYTRKGVHCAAAPHTLSLQQSSINMPDAEEVIYAKIPPELGLALLPYHKHRSTLPLAFTPFKTQVREDRRAAALPRAKHPPSAIQWPKKKKSKKTRQRQSARLAQS